MDRGKREIAMALQKTDWGQILWLNEEKEILSIPGLQAGIEIGRAHV